MTSPDFYRNARAYDIAFGNRDFDAECNFLEWCLRTHGRLEIGDWGLTADELLISNPHAPRPISHSFLELACGPARHAREFTRRGWRAVGLDMSEDMLHYVRDEVNHDGTRIETIQADMCNFTLAQPVAMAANLMESLSHLVTNAQVVAHLQAVARNLLPGGVFVIEMAHPAVNGKIDEPNIWYGQADGMSVEMLFGLPDDPYDPITQQWTITSRLTIRENGQPEQTIESCANHRWYGVQELAALIELSGAYEQVWWYGSFSLPPRPLDNSDEADRMMVVLRK